MRGNKVFLYIQTLEVLVGANEEITDDMAVVIQNAGVTQVVIRSALTCKSRYGICRKCYGRNLATGGHVDIGEAVGIIAAQSIGEPGTQLTSKSCGLMEPSVNSCPASTTSPLFTFKRAPYGTA